MKLECQYKYSNGQKCRKPAKRKRTVFLDPEIRSHDESWYQIFTCEKHGFDDGKPIGRNVQHG